MVCRRCGKNTGYGYALGIEPQMVTFCLDCGITTVAELAREGLATYVIPPQAIKIDDCDYEVLDD